MKHQYKIIRPILWFAKQQIIETTKLKEYFTNKAIKDLIKENYLE